MLGLRAFSLKQRETGKNTENHGKRPFFGTKLAPIEKGSGFIKKLAFSSRGCRPEKITVSLETKDYEEAVLKAMK
jgi:hypothetical protein